MQLYSNIKKEDAYKTACAMVSVRSLQIKKMITFKCYLSIYLTRRLKDIASVTINWKQGCNI